MTKVSFKKYFYFYSSFNLVTAQTIPSVFKDVHIGFNMQAIKMDFCGCHF